MERIYDVVLRYQTAFQDKNHKDTNLIAYQAWKKSLKIRVLSFDELKMEKNKMKK